MTARSFGALACGAALALAPLWAHAQESEPAHDAVRAVSAGGEITGVLGPVDNLAFFNYTDYHHNALRIGRLRLFGEWRPAGDRLAVVAELRSENGTGIEAPALYLRWRPSAARPFVVQAGRIPPVIGAFPRRAYGRDNVVLGLPLAYQYLTSLRPDALPLTVDDLLRMRARGWQTNYPLGSTALAPGISLVSISRFDTGAEATWTGDILEVAGAVTEGAPAIPVVRDRNGGRMWSGRAAAHLPAGVTAGVSAARGQWLNDSVLALTPGRLSTPSSQSLLGTDFEYGFGRWLVRSEWIRSRFQLPIGSGSAADTTLTASSGFVEGRVQILPRWSFGMRGERLTFSDVTGTLRGGVPTPWDAPVSRAEATLGFRLSRRVDVRGGWQQNWRSAGRVHNRGFPAVAALFWF